MKAIDTVKPCKSKLCCMGCHEHQAEITWAIARKEVEKERDRMRECHIKIRYPGSIISVNHYKYKGGIYTKPEARAWMVELGWLLKQYHLENWKLPLEVWCHGKFQDRRSQPDLSNLSKVILDAIEELTGINDRDMRWHDGEVRIVKGEEPELLIVVKEYKP